MKKMYFITMACLFAILTGHAQLITATGSVSNARMQHQSKMLSNGKVVAFGGNNGNGSSYIVYGSSEIYNPSAGTWSSTGSLNKARTHHASVLLSNGNILAIGGKNANGDILASCEIYNATSGTWSYTDSLPTGSYYGQAVSLNTGDILYVSGVGTSTCYLYNQSSNTWTATGALNIPRAGSCSVVKLADGKVLAAGGNSQTSAEVYNPTTGTWTLTTGNMSTQHNYNQSILLSNNKVLIAAGDGTKVSEIYDPTTGTFSTAGNMLQYCSSCPMINLANGKVLIFGIGNIFNPTDKQCLQVFNPTTNTWYSAGVIGTSIYGASVYTVEKLQTGKILYVAGNFTTGNGASAYCYLVNEGSIAAGIETISNFTSIQFYPNPCSDYLTISMELKKDEKFTITVSDCIGKNILLTKDKSAGNIYRTEFDFSDLNSGIYFITIQTENEKTTHKVIKQ